MFRRSAVTGLALALALTLAACGESKQDKAQKTVCGARAEIKAIGDSLAKIAAAQGDLTGDRKQEAQKATQTFKSEVSGVTRDLVTSVSLADGKQQIRDALDGLASSYRTAFAPLDCS